MLLLPRMRSENREEGQREKVEEDEDVICPTVTPRRSDNASWLFATISLLEAAPSNPSAPKILSAAAVAVWQQKKRTRQKTTRGMPLISLLRSVLSVSVTPAALHSELPRAHATPTTASQSLSLAPKFPLSDMDDDAKMDYRFFMVQIVDPCAGGLLIFGTL